MKYILILLLLISTNLSAWSCKEPEWLGIGDQMREQCVGDLDIVVTVQTQKRGWVKFYATCTNKELDDVYGYAKYVSGKWQLVTFGTGIAPDDCDELGIPKWIR